MVNARHRLDKLRQYATVNFDLTGLADAPYDRPAPHRTATTARISRARGPDGRRGHTTQA